MHARKQRDAIVASGGALLIDELLSDDCLARLSEECRERRSSAREQFQALSGHGRWRSADPARHLMTADGGPEQMAFYNDPGLHACLAEWCGFPVHPTSGCGTYSYYDQQGHYLARHRDIRRCDVTLVTCLQRTEGTEPSGALRVYPHSVRTPLEQVDDNAFHLDLHPREGQSVLLLGGCVPHEVLPAAIGFRRWISVLCFEMRSG